MTCCAAVSAGATWQQAAPVHCGALALLAAPQLLRRDDGMVVPLGPLALPCAPVWTITSPLFVTFLLTRVSGVPLLEKKYDAIYANDKAYQV